MSPDETIEVALIEVSRWQRMAMETEMYGYVIGQVVNAQFSGNGGWYMATVIGFQTGFIVVDWEDGTGTQETPKERVKLWTKGWIDVMQAPVASPVFTHVHRDGTMAVQQVTTTGTRTWVKSGNHQRVENIRYYIVDVATGERLVDSGWQNDISCWQALNELHRERQIEARLKARILTGDTIETEDC